MSNNLGDRERVEQILGRREAWRAKSIQRALKEAKNKSEMKN
jgi:hypothetical protein